MGRRRLAIVGGGAAGFFLAVNVKRMAPALEVTIYERAQRVLRCAELSRKAINRLTEVLTNDGYTIASRCHYKEEFVTCGGVRLSDVNHKTLESKLTPRLYYAGEVLDIDGITGGFNLQAAWTTAYVVAEAIAFESE